jgi:hypothetical protein
VEDSNLVPKNASNFFTSSATNNVSKIFYLMELVSIRSE